MRKVLFAAAAAMALIGAGSAANATITVSDTVANDLYGTTLAAHGMVMLDDFDGIDSVWTSYVGNIIEYPSEFELPNASTTASPPYPGSGVQQGGIDVDPTNYASVQGGTSATYTILGGNSLRAFSFYMGSPDSYNKVTFNLVGGGSEVFEGADIWGGTPEGNGDRSVGYRVYYDFGGAQVSSITFESSQNAFEFDGLAGAVPEPGTWALMIMGFGGAGAMLRSRRRLTA